MPGIKPIVIAGLCVALVGTACGGSEKTSTAEPTPQPKQEAGVLGGDLARVTHDDVARADLDAYIQGQTAFSLDLYRSLAARNTKNFAIGPESLTTALAMLMAGASDEGQREIAQALGVENLVDRVPAVVNQVMRDLESRGGGSVTLEEANRIYSDPQFVVKAAFVELLAKEFGAPMVQIDFANEPEAARKQINVWVAEKTRDKIPELFPEGSIDDSTVATLVNAVYLKAKWKTAFDEKRTSDQEFTTVGGAKVHVPMMHTDDIATTFGTGYGAAELPYKGDELSMVVIVPDDLAAFEKAFDAETLAAIVDGLQGAAKLDLALPRFEVEGGGELKDQLQALGIKAVFQKNALQNISDDPRIEVSTVQHQVYVKVDEEGTEAAAATGIGIRATSLPPPGVVADKPFVYLVRDKATGAVLFLGRITNPLEK
jgi:serpin B